MKKFSVSLLFTVLFTMALFAVIPLYAADTLTYTVDGDVASGTFVYKSATDGHVISNLQNVANGTKFAKGDISFGSFSGTIRAAVYLGNNKSVVLVAGKNYDSLKILSMPTTNDVRYADVVTTKALDVVAKSAEMVKLSNTKLLLTYQTEDATKCYAHIITVNSGMTTLTLNAVSEITVSNEVAPIIARVSATKAVVYYQDASNLKHVVYDSANGTGTFETAVTGWTGKVSQLSSDSYAHVLIGHKAGTVPTINVMSNSDTTSMTNVREISLSHLANSVVLGDICALDSTYAVYLYKSGTSTYVAAVNTDTSATGEATLVSTSLTGNNFIQNKMLVKLDATHVAVAAQGVTKVFTLNTSTLALTLFGQDSFESQDKYAPVLYDVYSDTAVTLPAIFRTHTDTPNACFRKISYIAYESQPRMGFVATGVSSGATTSVQLNGVITKTNSVNAGVNLYVDNSGALVESPAGCIDSTPVGVKMQGTSILLK